MPAGAGSGGGTATGDYAVTQNNGQFRLSSNTVIVGSGDNPTIAVTRGQEYSFSLDLDGLQQHLIF